MSLVFSLVKMLKILKLFCGVILHFAPKYLAKSNNSIHLGHTIGLKPSWSWVQKYPTFTELRKDDWNSLAKYIETDYALKVEIQLCKRLGLIVEQKEKEKFLLLLGQNYFAK